MTKFIFRAALIAGAALAAAGCNRGATETNNAAANELDANMTMGEPANDASAMESTTNASEPVAPAQTNATDSGSQSGGDAGGNNVESNTVGM